MGPAPACILAMCAGTSQRNAYRARRPRAEFKRGTRNSGLSPRVHMCVGCEDMLEGGGVSAAALQETCVGQVCVVRELTLCCCSQGAGGVIPPNADLVFEVTRSSTLAPPRACVRTRTLAPQCTLNTPSNTHAHTHTQCVLHVQVELFKIGNLGTDPAGSGSWCSVQ
jgi:hypothetical protein